MKIGSSLGAAALLALTAACGNHISLDVTSMSAQRLVDNTVEVTVGVTCTQMAGTHFSSVGSVCVTLASRSPSS